jgi:membrane protein YqaA with SNARE-associated domain
MLAPMSLAKPDKAWFYALVTTVASVLGGLLGYLIGSFAFELIEPYIHSMGYWHKFELAQQWFTDYGFWAILLAGFTPIPYKVFTIASGVAGMLLVPFILGSLIGRGGRFFLVASLMYWGGEALEHRLHKMVDVLGWVTVVLVVVGYLLFK